MRRCPFYALSNGPNGASSQTASGRLPPVTRRLGSKVDVGQLAMSLKKTVQRITSFQYRRQSGQIDKAPPPP